MKSNALGINYHKTEYESKQIHYNGSNKVHSHILNSSMIYFPVQDER
jgi:hypothetical protein